MMVDLPSHESLHWPTITALRVLGGSAAIGELNSEVISSEEFTVEQQGILHGDGPQTELEYRLAWARTYLKNFGLITNSKRAVWSLTDSGLSVGESELAPLLEDFKSRFRSRDKGPKEVGGKSSLEEFASDPTWQEALLGWLMNLDAPAFERLTQRLLREAGFTNTTVTGRAGDGGIDGRGVYRISLLSFQAFFQCKRYAGSVGAPAVRDFRGAMAGRGDKGLLITTGTFTADAQKEATRDGAAPIDLIDGSQLCELLKEHRLGVSVRTRTVEDVEIDPTFFDSLS